MSRWCSPTARSRGSSAASARSTASALYSLQAIETRRAAAAADHAGPPTTNAIPSRRPLERRARVVGRGRHRHRAQPVPVGRCDRDLPRAGLPAPRVLVVGDIADRRRAVARSAPSSASSWSQSTARASEPAARRPRRWSSPRTGATSCTRCARGLEAGVPYVGLVASRKRGAAVLDELRADGVPEELLGADRRPGRARHRRPHAGRDRAVDPGEDRSRCAASGRHAPRRDRRCRGQRPVPAVAAAPAIAIDPICGMTVARSPSTPLGRHDGETVYFCCEGCKRDVRAESSRAA